MMARVRAPHQKRYAAFSQHRIGQVFAALLLALALPVFAQTQPQASTPALRSTPSKQDQASSSNSLASWKDLSPAQQQALAPLRDEWNQLNATRKHKWLKIADRFPHMKSEEQQRIQARMREWAQMTPAQRRVARDSYARAKEVPPEQRAQLLKQYQQLPDKKKQQLAHENKSPGVLTLPELKPAPKAAKPSKAQIREGAERVTSPVLPSPASSVVPSKSPGLASTKDLPSSTAPVFPISPGNTENAPNTTSTSTTVSQTVSPTSN